MTNIGGSDRQRQKKELTMKSLNHLLVAAVAVLTVNASMGDESRTVAAARYNAAFLTSPRYLEKHPELQRTQSARRELRALRPEMNVALANSPRFREQHPEFRFGLGSTRPAIPANVSGKLPRLTENKALATSPRYLEEHPELQRRSASFEIAPFK
jgi:hypothetical protein